MSDRRLNVQVGMAYKQMMRYDNITGMEILHKFKKRQNVNGEIKVKRKLCVVKRRRKMVTFIYRRAVGFLILGQKNPSNFHFPADFNFSTNSQFQLKSAILTFSTCFSACIRRPITERYFAVCCSCPAQYGTVHTAIC